MLASHREELGIEEFLAWVGHQDGRYELAEGVPVRLMAGAKQSHNVVVGNMADAMRAAAKAAGCRTTSSDTAVVTGAKSIRYPDIVVDCGPADPDALAALWPTILVEVLSRSTSQIDFLDKVDEYKSLASIEIILVVDPDVVSVKLYQKRDEGTWISQRYEDLDAVIALPGIATTISLSAIYDTLQPKRKPPIAVVWDQPAMP